MSTDRYISAKTVAKRYDVCLATIWRWADNGTLPKPIKISKGSTRWSLAELEERDAKILADATG